MSFSKRTIFFCKFRQISVLVESCSSEIGGVKRLPNERILNPRPKNKVLCMWFMVCSNVNFERHESIFVSLGINYWNKIHSIRFYTFVLLNGSHKYWWIGIDVLFHVKISLSRKPKRWTTEKTSAIKFGYFSLSAKYAVASKLHFDEHLYTFSKQPDNRYRITREAAASWNSLYSCVLKKLVWVLEWAR